MVLDKAQEEVVSYPGSAVCIAGPGSGKTRVLTEKARRTFEGGKSVLCLCFTRTAAQEVIERVPGVPAATIHSFCCGTVGWKDEWGYSGLLFRFLISNYKSAFNTVLVDECQDLNPMELDVVMSLVGENLFAVGDPYQSIYGFQGALGHEAIDRFKKVGCKEFHLKNNYRSSPEITNELNIIYPRDLVSAGIKETGLTSILTRTNDDLFYVSKFLQGQNIPHRLRLSADVGDAREKDILGESNLRLSTIHCSKGLEFDRVCLWDWRPKEKGEETRVYYVAMSRASKAFLQVD